jgi:UDP-GlcNAc:undecaprenyl-phosphate GlcNAc-1-phosphate transferase
MSFTDAVDALTSNEAFLWGFVCAAAIVLVLTPLVGWLAPRIGGLDHGDDRPRIHTRAIPRIGGVAIVLGIIISALLFVDLEGPYPAILIGTGAIAVVGVADDIWGISPWAKLAAVAAVSLIPVIGADLTFRHITLPLIGDHDVGWVGYPLTVLWIVLLANLINLIDGMDSLAAGIVAIASASFALLAASWGRADAAVLAGIVCAATLAFLWHNYHPAKIFMGDSGALALGFLLATVSVEGVLKTAATIALVAPLLLIAVPILDTSFVVLKRLKYRRPAWGADHNHFYHRFLRIGYSQRRTAAYLHVWAALVASYALLLRFLPPRPGGEIDVSNAAIAAVGALAVLLTSVWMVYNLEILKARHLEALGLRRFAPPVDGAPELAEEDGEEPLERALTTHR